MTAPVASCPALEQYIAGPCPQFEGDISHFYLDTKGLVTVATGCMIPDIASAVLLPMRSQPGGPVAGIATITADYLRVKKMPFGQRYGAAFYKSPESLVMDPDDRLALRRQRAVAFLGDLRLLFPGFDSFPLDEQLGLFDMIFNLGKSRLATEYIHFCAFIRARNPHAAAAECARNTADKGFIDRNIWTCNRFLAAAVAGA